MIETGANLRQHRGLRNTVALGLVWVGWGGSYPALGIVANAFDPLEAAAIRFTVAGLISLAIVLITTGFPVLSRREWGSIFLVGAIVIAFGQGAIMASVLYVSPGIVALIFACTPAIALILEAFVKKSRLSRRSLLSILLGIFGVSWLLTSGSVRIEPLGVVLAFGAASSYALGAVFVERSLRLVPSLAQSAIQMTIGGVLLALVFLVTRPEPLRVVEVGGWEVIVAMAYLILIGSVGGYFAYNWLLQNRSIQLASSFAYVNPVVALGLGVVFFSEPLALMQSLAVVPIIGSVILLLSRPTDLKTGPIDLSAGQGEASV